MDRTTYEVLKKLSTCDLMSWIKAESKLQKITQTKLAEKAKIARSTMCQYMKGDRTVSFDAMSEFLDVLGHEIQIVKKWKE